MCDRPWACEPGAALISLPASGSWPTSTGADGHPLNRPADPPSWLSPDGLRHAWVVVPVGMTGHSPRAPALPEEPPL